MADLVVVLGLAATVAAPITAYIIERAKLKQTEKIEQSKIELAKLEQQHKIEAARREQSHKIASEYLDRVLQPDATLWTRQQLLRFLAIGDRDDRLAKWAADELRPVEQQVEVLKAPLERANQAIKDAKSLEELQSAERVFSRAQRVFRSGVGAPSKPRVSAAAIRTGLYQNDDESLRGLAMVGWDLRGAELITSNMDGSDLSDADLTEAKAVMAKLRGAILHRTRCVNALMIRADLRNADLRGADLRGTNFQGARLEGADLRDVQLTRDADYPEKRTDLRAIFDQFTQWPEGFDPTAWGAVPVGDEGRVADEQAQPGGPS